MTAVTGRSGSGKSTLLFALARLIRIRRGQILYAGRRIDCLGERDSNRWRGQSVGFIFQDAQLQPHLTIRQNLVIGTAYNHQSEPADDYLCSALIDVGVDVDLGRKPGQISGGQAQRIALVRVMLRQPEIVLADEPTANLDRDSRELVYDRLTALAAGGSVVVISTHLDETVSRCDRTLRLDDSCVR